MGIITTRSRYGLRILIELARLWPSGTVDLASVAGSLRIPALYASKLMPPLKSAGIVRSERGAKGGFSLARSPERIGLLEIVEALEGASALVSCPGVVESRGDCGVAEGCAASSIWKGLDGVVRRYLDGITLAEAALVEIDFSI